MDSPGAPPYAKPRGNRRRWSYLRSAKEVEVRLEVWLPLWHLALGMVSDSSFEHGTGLVGVVSTGHLTSLP